MVVIKVNVTKNEYQGIRRVAGKGLTVSQYCRLKMGLPIILPENDSLDAILKAANKKN